MAQKRILVFAYSDVGYACLKFMLERGENVVQVLTHADKPNEQIWFPSVSKLCIDFKIPYLTDPDLKSPDVQNKIKELSPDLIFSFYFRNLIPKTVLDMAPLGAYNLHGSYLPSYRGRAPVNWAVLNGETKTGATLHVMTEKPDAGDIIDQEAVVIGPDDAAIAVQSRVTQAAVIVMGRQIDNLKKGTAPRKVQNNSLSSYYGGRKPEDGRIKWINSSEEIHNLVRAVTHPYPGAFTDILGKKTYIWGTRLARRETITPIPGKFVSEKNRLFVICGDGKMLEILRIQNEGEPELSGIEFAHKNRLQS